MVPLLICTVSTGVYQAAFVPSLAVALIGVLILHEHLTLSAWIGCALILTGVIITCLPSLPRGHSSAVGVWQVTQRNARAQDPGIDGEVALTSGVTTAWWTKSTSGGQKSAARPSMPNARGGGALSGIIRAD